MSSNKLHPIYKALDNQQYKTAIKLCLAQPTSNVLCQALLAHSYAKAGQRLKALLTIQKILPNNGSGTSTEIYFPEFQFDLMYAQSLERSVDTVVSSSTQPTTTAVPQKKNVIKKGKKKNVSSSTQPSQSTLASTAESSTPPTFVLPEGWDLVDQLDTPPMLPNDWERLPPSVDIRGVDPEQTIVESTLLSTLAMTMLNQLKLPLTAYQLYCWASSASNISSEDEEVYLRKSYTVGLIVLLSPQYHSITTKILSNMQVLALQLAKYNATSLAASQPIGLWASQTALWQIQFAASDNDESTTTTILPDEKKDARLRLLPRLAESLALKNLQNFSSNKNNDTNFSLVATESFHLYIRTLDIQGEAKYQEKQELIDRKLNETIDTTEEKTMMFPPRQTLLRLRVDNARVLGQFSVACEALQDLIKDYPDDWEYWKLHLDCSIGNNDGNILLGCIETSDLAKTYVSGMKEKVNNYPLRAPYWIALEIASRRCNGTNGSSTDETSQNELIDNIIIFGNEFASRASSTFSDVSPYLDSCLDNCSRDQALRLLEWSSVLRILSSSDNAKIRQSELRSYIFSTQIMFKVITKFQEFKDNYLPKWQDLIEVWKTFQRFEMSIGGDQAQKENRPADEIVLLATQCLLQEANNTTNRLLAVCLLEEAIRYSPYNAYLKICAIFVYHQLSATSRCWSLYLELFTKHIQHESCSYLILPILRSGGFYRETIQVCQDILGLQRTSTREAGDFAGRAMNNGTIGKADEILTFHRNRMFKSLTTLEAKGLVLDCAPMFIQDSNQGSVGAVHGIVGGEADVERVKQMIAEAHNPSGAFSLLRLKGSVTENISNVSDNRDFGIMSFELLQKTEFDSISQILSESIRRGCHHNILIRATLCVDATKAPKKGKTIKNTLELEKRCKSLLMAVKSTDESIDSNLQPRGYISCLNAIKNMSIALVALSAGINAEAEYVYNGMDERETAVVDLLRQTCQAIKEAQMELALNQELCVSRTSRLLPDCIVPMFALFQMTSKVVEAFGWGKRKRKTKACAGAVADVAGTLCSLLDEMLLSVTNVLDIPVPLVTFEPSYSSTSLDPTTCQETFECVIQSRQITKDRIETILFDIKKTLLEFDVEDV